MKLIVQIPCFNEEATLHRTVADIPREITGVDEVRILVVDDGSTDRTVEVAAGCGVDYVVRHKRNQGLARAFRSGIDASLRLGADIIVNTDGDNQYAGSSIADLIAPIVRGEADIVVGDRDTGRVAYFSPGKKRLQRLGSAVVQILSRIELPDAVSGFRALSRDAALQMNIVSPFSYTIEMLIQAGKKHLVVTSVPVSTNPKTRESRLFGSALQFIGSQIATMVRTYAMYQPLRVFFYVGLVLSSIGLVPIVRFLYFYLGGDSTGHIQSLVLGGTFLVMGFMMFMIGLVADLISFNRQLLEMIVERVRRLEIGDPGGSRVESPGADGESAGGGAAAVRPDQGSSRNPDTRSSASGGARNR